MKTPFNFIALATFLLVMGLSTDTFAQKYSESDLQRTFQRFLTDEGIESTVDSDGDIQFEYEDRNYFIEVNENDNEFFRLVLFNIWEIESRAEHEEVQDACDAVNREAKVAKAYTTNENVWIATEMFIERPDHYEGVFYRCLQSIDNSVGIFVREMRE